MAQAAGSGRWASCGLVWAGLGLLAACTSVNPPAPGPAPPELSDVAPSPQAAARSPMPPRPARKPPVRMASLPPTSSPPPPSNEVEDGSFDRLQGLDAAGMVALLGEPGQRAEAPPGILWRYASRDCQLDVYFYLDLQSREMRVLHYEIRDNDDGAERTQPKCYRELVAERHAEQGGSADRPR